MTKLVEAMRGHRGVTVPIATAFISMVAVRLFPVEESEVIGDSSVVTILGVLLSGALVMAAVFQVMTQEARSDLHRLSGGGLPWEGVEPVLDGIEREFWQDVRFVLVSFLAASSRRSATSSSRWATRRGRRSRPRSSPWSP